MNKAQRILFLILFLSSTYVFAQIKVDSTFSVCFKKSIRMPLDYLNNNPVITVASVGDIMLGEGASTFIKTRGLGYPFKNVKRIIRKVDIATCNLESPFTRDGIRFKKKFNFKVNPDFAGALKIAGFDLASLANNHILDFGKQGLVSTLNVLDSLNIAHVGAGLNGEMAETPAVITRNGNILGFLSYSLTYPAEFWACPQKCGTAYPSFNRVKKSIQELKARCDFVIVQFHWGSELRTTPKSYQKWYAHASIDAGADVVIGHHPHVLQGVEIYKGKLIAYSLGNFVFGSYSRNVKRSIILKIWFDKKDILLSEVIPVSVNNYRVLFSPEILGDKKKIGVVKLLNKLSYSLNNGKNIFSSSGLISLKMKK